MQIYMSDGSVWGTYADWANAIGAFLAAIATILAVVVALRTSRESATLAIQMKLDDRQLAEAAERALKQQLAIAFDHELHMTRGEFSFTLGHLRQAIAEKDLDYARETLTKYMPHRGFILLDRFADRIPLFGSPISDELMVLFGLWLSVRDAPPFTLHDESDPWQAIAHVVQTFEAATQRMAHARDLLRPLIPVPMRAPADEDFIPPSGPAS